MKYTVLQYGIHLISQEYAVVSAILYFFSYVISEKYISKLKDQFSRYILIWKPLF